MAAPIPTTSDRRDTTPTPPAARRHARRAALRLAAAVAAASAVGACANPQSDTGASAVVEAPAAASFALVDEIDLGGVIVGLAVHAGTADDPRIGALQLVRASDAFVPGATTLRAFAASGAETFAGTARLRVSWTDGTQHGDNAAIVAWQPLTGRWERPPVVAVTATSIEVEVARPAAWALVRVDRADALAQLAPASTATIAAGPAIVGDGPQAAEAAVAAEKAIVRPSFFVRTPLLTPVAAGSTLCMRYSLNGGPFVNVPMRFGTNKWIAGDVAVDEGTPMRVRYFESPSTACTVETRAIFNSDSAAWHGATYVADTLATACSTDTGAACGTYFLTGVVETKRTFVPTGTLACPGSPGFAGDDVDGVVETCPEIDACPDDPLKMSPGACGCGVADTDSDTDGTPDCLDGCSDDPLKTETGVCGCGVSDADSDNDDIADCDDFCPEVPGEGFPAPPQFDCNNAGELGGEPLLVALGDFCGNPEACPAESWGASRGTVFADACEGFASCGPFEFFGLGQICDGFADCSNGLDEQGCVAGVGLVCE